VFFGGGTVENKDIHTMGICSKRDISYLLLLLPAVGYLLIFFIYPLTKIFYLSFIGSKGNFSIEHYVRIFEGGISGIYVKSIILTFQYSFYVTVICLLLSYPVAALMAKIKTALSTKLMLLVLIPFWTSTLIRVYSWSLILSRNGFINTLLKNAHLVTSPLALTYNTLGMVIGTVHVLLPYMIFPIFSSIKGINQNLLRAAASLGASGINVFFRVYFPLTLPGVASGCLLVFIMTLGFYITPAMMGGGSKVVTEMIDLQINELLNWGLGSALAFVLLGFTLILYFITARWFGIDSIWGGMKNEK
jgi:ABC-type spermidine/putrescine transport system permease subunit I